MKNRKLSFLALIYCVSLTVFSHRQSDASSNDLSAEEIVQQISDRYGRSRSYSDKGSVKRIFHERDRRTEKEIRFSTIFRAPHEFRFEFVDLDPLLQRPRYIIHRDGQGIRSRWTLEPKEETYSTVRDALHAAAGISNLTSMAIPGLLFIDEMSPCYLNNLMDLRRLADEKERGIKCFKICGKDKIGNEVIVWIDQSKILVRKIYSKSLDATESITIYEPEINRRVSGKDLRF